MRNIVVPDEWRENFRMSRDSFYVLCNKSVHDVAHVTAVILYSVNGRAKWTKFVWHSVNTN